MFSGIVEAGGKSMLIQPLNELTLGLQFKAMSPLLIKEGRYGDPEKKKWATDVIEARVGAQQGKQADDRRRTIQAQFPSSIPISRNSTDEIEKALKGAIQTDNRLDPEAADKLLFYVPGSSIRGAWRSYLERWLRGIDPEEPRVCDPFQEKKTEQFYSCSHLLSDRKTAIPAYANSCPVCRLFGNTMQGSRISISDADRVAGTGSLVSREHINIRRDNQQVKTPPGPFRFLALQGAEFACNVKVRNFELIQVALAMEILKAMHAQYILLGSGKNKGYGAVALLSTFSATATHVGAEPKQELRGIGEHAACDAAMRERYGLIAGKAVNLPQGKAWQKETPWRWSVKLTYPELSQISDGILSQINNYWPNVPKLSARPREATA
jgi:CRISPR/Cas system CSM-associated protein Csm3 (group 7 of RAMP superfamily)